MFESDVLVTGCTGFLGRHILYELIGMEEFKGNIYLLMRNREGETVEQRLEEILSAPSLPENYHSKAMDCYSQNRIKLIAGDLNDSEAFSGLLDHSVDDKKKLVVIHSAGSVNLLSNESAREEVYKYNYTGTLKLLSALKDKIEKFIYVSTAYSVGQVDGIVNDEFDNVKRGPYRNPYEECKSDIEHALIEISKKEKWKLSIIRPSIICGRYYDSPKYYTSKFDVFYSWVKFFWKISKRNESQKIRIHATEQSKLNIVPVDYVAKAVCAAWKNGVPFLNIVNPVPISTRAGMSKVLEMVNFSNYEFVDENPTDLNRLEQFYYTTVGAIYGQYIVGSNTQYDSSRLERLMSTLPTPEISPYLGEIVEFAANHCFDENKKSK